MKFVNTFRIMKNSKSIFWGIFFFALSLTSYAQQNQINTLKNAYKNAQNDAERLIALNNLTEWFANKKTDSAQVYAKLAYQIHEKAPNDYEKIRAIVGLGNALSKTKASEGQARPYFERALEQAQKTNDSKTLGFAHFHFGNFCFYKSNIEEAITQFEQAQKQYEQANMKTELQTVYHQIGSAYGRVGKAKNALDNYLKALRLLKVLKREDTSGILSDIGNVYYNQGSFIEALNYYRQALDNSRQLQDAFGQGFSLNNIGMVHNSLGNHEEALEYHLQALKMREEAKTQEGIANSYSNIGHTYLELGYTEKGRKYIMQAIEIDKKLGNRLSVASYFDYIGAAFLQNKKYQDALEQFKEAFKIRLEMGQVMSIGVSYNHLGITHTYQKDFPNAIANLKKADSIFTQSNAQDLLVTTHLALSKVYFELNDFAKSENYATNALKSALKRKTKPEIVEASHILAQLYAKQGSHAKAYELQNQALAYKDSLHNEERNTRAMRLQALFEFKQQEKELKELKNDNVQITRLQYITVAIFIVLTIVLGIFIYTLWVSRKRNQLKNKILAIKNAEIIQQADEIIAQKQAIENQNSELQKTHKHLQEANQELIDSINYAHRIQKAVLPTQAEIMMPIPSHFILYKPRNVVSGDFYWVSDKEHHTVVAVMDCTGHGIPGAFMSLIGNDILHEIVNLREIIEPSRILTELKKRVNTVLKQHTTKGRDGMDIGICTIDHVPIRQGIERKLYFSAAHLSLFYFQNRQMNELEGSKIYVGGYDPDDTEKHFETQIISLEKPTTCYLFSDGYQDQFAENSKKKFTKKRLKNLLTDVQLLPPELQHEILEETIDEWKGQNEQTDDIIIFGMML